MSNKYLEKVAALIYHVYQAGNNTGEDGHRGGHRKFTNEKVRRDTASKMYTIAKNEFTFLGRIKNKLSGSHVLETEKGTGRDIADRVAPVVTSVQFSKKDFSPEGQDKVFKRFNDSLDLHIEDLKKDPGRVGFDADKFKQEHFSKFKEAYSKTKNLRRKAKIAKIVGAASLGLVGIGALVHSGKKENK